MHRAVFLDRDGTLIVEKHYLNDPEEVELFPGVGEALRALQDRGYLLVVVTNQSGIGRGLFTVEQMKSVNQRMEDCLAGAGVRIAATYFAPEAPDQPSRGRKPSPQFLFDAREGRCVLFELGRALLKPIARDHTARELEESLREDALGAIPIDNALLETDAGQRALDGPGRYAFGCRFALEGGEPRPKASPTGRISGAG